MEIAWMIIDKQLNPLKVAGLLVIYETEHKAKIACKLYGSATYKVQKVKIEETLLDKEFMIRQNG